MNSKEFSLIIEGVVKEKKPITYMDAILWYCEQNTIEVESVGRLISKNLKEKREESLDQEVSVVDSLL